jgi:hypothetical protein
MCHACARAFAVYLCMVQSIFFTCPLKKAASKKKRSGIVHTLPNKITKKRKTCTHTKKKHIKNSFHLAST